MSPAFAGSLLFFGIRNPKLALWANDMPSAFLTARQLSASD
jgi:hypothetical protein